MSLNLITEVNHQQSKLTGSQSLKQTVVRNQRDPIPRWSILSTAQSRQTKSTLKEWEPLPITVITGH